MHPRIDTRRIVDGLRDHFTQEQVEALTIVLVETLPEIVATKEDVDLLRAEVVTTRGDLTLMWALRARHRGRFLALLPSMPGLLMVGVLVNALVTAVMAVTIVKLMVH